MSFVSNILRTVALCTTLKPNGKFCGNCLVGYSLKESNALNGSVLTKVASAVVWLYIFILYSTLYSLPVNKIILCFIIQGKGFSKKGLILNSGEKCTSLVASMAFVFVCIHAMK